MTLREGEKLYGWQNNTRKIFFMCDDILMAWLIIFFPVTLLKEANIQGRVSEASSADLKKEC